MARATRRLRFRFSIVLIAFDCLRLNAIKEYGVQEADDGRHVPDADFTGRSKDPGVEACLYQGGKGGLVVGGDETAQGGVDLLRAA